MTIQEIAILPWAVSDLKAGWDFRNKTSADLEPMCFGAYENANAPGECKIVYGGALRASKAIEELAALGIVATVEPPHDALIGNEEDGYDRIKGWSYNVRFRLP